MITARAVLLAVVCVLAFGCKEKNPNYCDPELPECMGPDAAVACDDNNPCTVGVCVSNVCVECTDNATCTDPAEPVCNTTTNSCEACTAHAQCDSEVCLPTGSCADELEVAYVAHMGPGTDCAISMPCPTLDAAVARNRPYIKIQGTTPIADTKVTTIDGKAVTIFAAPGAKLSRSGTGPILEVKSDNADVTIYDLEITGGTGTGGDAVHLSSGTAKLTLERVTIHTNGGYGVFAQSGGKLVMKQCVVSGNTQGGGNIQNLVFELTNNIFVANGAATSTTGGLTLSPAVNSIFEFNTVADNTSTGATTATRGINCVIPQPITNSIISGNAAGPTCAVEYSLLDAGAAGTNRMGAPMFVSTDFMNPTGATYYRIMSGSPAVDGANDAGVAADDIDGDERPQGDGKDMGADEVMP